MNDVTIPVEQGEDSGPQIIKSTSSPGCAFVGLLVFAIIWDGLVLTFTGVVWSPKHHGFSILPVLFLIPFQLAGIGLLGAVVYSFLGLFNPRPTLVCSQQYIYPGNEFELSWMFEKSVGRIQSLIVYLEGLEQVTYRQGTSNRTESNVFYRHIVVDTAQSADIAQGMRLITLPENIMHTFTTTSNKILFRVRFNGTIRFWPDVVDVFEINVLPPRID
jgi:hypothetical protein